MAGTLDTRNARTGPQLAPAHVLNTCILPPQTHMHFVCNSITLCYYITNGHAVNPPAENKGYEIRRSRICSISNFGASCFTRKMRDVSMRHKHRQIGLGDDLPGRVAEDQLADAALRVAAFDDEIGAEPMRGFEHG